MHNPVRTVGGTPQTVVHAQPDGAVGRRFDQDQIGAGMVHRAQRSVQRVRETVGRGRQTQAGVGGGWRVEATDASGAPLFTISLDALLS